MKSVRELLNQPSISTRETPISPCKSYRRLNRFLEDSEEVCELSSKFFLLSCLSY